MRHDFSSAFLIIRPPATSFGEAWELLCMDLLAAEHGIDALLRPGPPDHGIDIYNRPTQHAYQCKASEKGAGGIIPPTASIESLAKAVVHRKHFPWLLYSLCTNAPYSSSGVEAIRKAADGHGLDQEAIAFLGPEYWDNLCNKYGNIVRDRFYYRVTADEKAVLDAFRSAGYYKQYVSEFADKIRRQEFSLVITNNRTPVQIEIPFSPELTVENYLDVAKELLGVTLKWTNYPDMGTAAGTSLSVTIDQYAQSFAKKIGDLPIRSGDPLQLWIKIVWKENTKESAPSDTHARVHFLRAAYFDTYREFEVPLLMRHLRTSEDRESVTISRQEALIQSMIWDRFTALRAATRAHGDTTVSTSFHTAGVFNRDVTQLDRAKRLWLQELIGLPIQERDRLHIEVLRPLEENGKEEGSSSDHARRVLEARERQRQAALDDPEQGI